MWDARAERYGVGETHCVSQLYQELQTDPVVLAGGCGGGGAGGCGGVGQVGVVGDGGVCEGDLMVWEGHVGGVSGVMSR